MTAAVPLNIFKNTDQKTFKAARLKGAPFSLSYAIPQNQARVMFDSSTPSLLRRAFQR